jgi:hypothetical protein
VCGSPTGVRARTWPLKQDRSASVPPFRMKAPTSNSGFNYFLHPLLLEVSGGGFALNRAVCQSVSLATLTTYTDVLLLLQNYNYY